MQWKLRGLSCPTFGACVLLFGHVPTLDLIYLICELELDNLMAS